MHDSGIQDTTRIAVLGAGHLGSAVARLAIRAGYPVDIAASGDPDNIALITELVIPGARPRWAGDAIRDAGLVVLAIPLHRFAAISPAPLDGKLVIDAMNYWPASDGVLESFEHSAPHNAAPQRNGADQRRGSSEIVAGRLAGSTVVKALNHIGYHDLEDWARPPGTADRKAAGVAGDNPGAVAAIAGFVDRIGYDPVALGGLRAGRVLQPGNPVFGSALARPEFEQAVLAKTTRPAKTTGLADTTALTTITGQSTLNAA